MKDEVISYIADRTGNIVNDAYTFLWVRTTHLKEFEAKGFGGGNLLVALGLFATMNYLGKVYYLLIGNPAHYNEKDELKVDETQAFKELILAVPTISRLGLKEDEIVPAYKEIRHKLTHRIAPDFGNTMLANISPNKDFETVRSIIETDKINTFEYKDGVRLCDVDRLARDVNKISLWLVGEIKASKFDPNIEVAFEWLEK